MDELAEDFSLFVKNEFNLDVSEKELKKLIGNQTVLFKTFQILIAKFRSKKNGEIIRKKLDVDEKNMKINKLKNDLIIVKEKLKNLIEILNKRKILLNEKAKINEFLDFKDLRVKLLINLLEQVKKSSKIEVDYDSYLNSIDQQIDSLDTKLNFDEHDNYTTNQVNYSLVEKQIEELAKSINDNIYEITDLSKNQDFKLEFNKTFLSNLTKTDYKFNLDKNLINVDVKEDERISKLSKHYKNYLEKVEALYNKHKNKVSESIQMLKEQ